MNTVEVIETIISLFESDSGDWTDEQKDYARRKWSLLDDSSKNYLNTRSNEDLENICIGEYRDTEHGVARLVNGEWQIIPPAVDSFLTDIWEF
jgi:hypothetical protein